jgi:5-methylcytosine-specific restriction enzyme subunit McrC
MSIQTIELQEYVSCVLPADALPQHVGKLLWSQYKEKVQVEPPTFKTDNHWRLTPQGWAGHIPIDEGTQLLIKPKVELDNLFRMLEYAYKLSFLTAGELIGTQSLQDFYERLAKILALRVLDRSRKGLYREYAERARRLPYLRGRVLLESMLRSPWEISLDCQYHENTADIEDNQILVWTLYCIARNRFCREDVAELVRRAYRSTRHVAETRGCPARLCDSRVYNRLNEDYRTLHALCRFFLDHSGPSHEQGGHGMLPFLIEMARLYEMFVAEWLRQHLSNSIILKDQAPFSLGGTNKVDFRVDLLLIDRETGRPLCLLDTKYKTPSGPGASDLEQVIAYAKALNCPEAVLIYPQALAKPFDHVVGGDIHVWTSTFGLSDNLEDQGHTFLAKLLAVLA